MANARSIKAGSAFVEFFLDDGKLQRGLKTAERRIGRFGSSLRSNGAALLGFGGILASPFIAGIKAASDMQETMNKFDVVFGENAASVKQWGDGFANQVGRSKKQIADFLASTQDLFVPLGFDSDSAEKFSKDLTGLAVDVASFNNKADADVLRDFHSALTGGGETVKKYGILLNVATMNAELLSQGIDPKKASEQEKVAARMQILLKGTTAAQGDAIRSAGAFENQTKRLTGKLFDAAVVIGNSVLPAVTPLVALLGDAVGWVERFVANNQELVGTLGTMVGVLLATGAALVVVGSGIQGLAFGIGGLGRVLKLVVGGFSLGRAAILGVFSIVSALLSPVGLLVGLLAGLAGYALYASGAINKLAGFLGGRLSTAWQTIVKLIASGNLKAAGTLALAGLKAVFSVGLGEINGFWIRFKGGLAATFLDLTGTLENAWLSFSGLFVDSMIRASAKVQSVFQGTSNKLAGYIATAIATATGQNVDDVLETLQEDQQRNNRDFEGEAERQIEQRREQREQQRQKNDEFTAAAIEEVDAQTAQAVEAAAGDVANAQNEFDVAQAAATALTEPDEAEEGDKIEEAADALERFTANATVGEQSVASANSGVDAQSTAGQEQIAIALKGITPTDPVDAIKSQTKTLAKIGDDTNKILQKAPVLKGAKT